MFRVWALGLRLLGFGSSGLGFLEQKLKAIVGVEA